MSAPFPGGDTDGRGRDEARPIGRRTVLRAAAITAVAGGAACSRPAPARPDTGPRGGRATWANFAEIAVADGDQEFRSSGYDMPGVGAACYRLDPDQRNRAPTRFRRRSADGRWFRIAEPAIGYTMAGARGDGTGGARADGTLAPPGGTDDTAAIQALYDHLAATGGGIALVEPRQFNVTGLRIAGSDIRTVGLGEISHVHVTSTAGRGAAFAAEGASAAKRLTGLAWENLRVSGGARWGATPFDFNDVLCGYGIRTRWVDDVRVVGCRVDHVSDSGVSIRDGARPRVEACTIAHVAQGIDIFFDCVDARVAGNVVRDIRVIAGINVEGRTPVGHPRGTVVIGNEVDGAVTSGIDVIEAFGTMVAGNIIADVSGSHPGFPGYSFGIHLFGSPGTRVAGNRVRGVRGTRRSAEGSRDTGVGIDVAANSGNSDIVGNAVRGCSRAACSVNDTRGTAATYDVLVDGNDFDTAVVLDGNATLRAGVPAKAVKEAL